LEQGRANDGATNRQQIIQNAGSLRIADLGYFNIPVLKSIDHADASFLSRVPHTTMVYIQGTKHNLVQWLNSTGLNTIDRSDD